MNANHTPGPWRVDSVWGLIKHGKTEICALHSGNAANARLIAAAPELLMVLRDARAAFIDGRAADLEGILTGDVCAVAIERADGSAA